MATKALHESSKLTRCEELWFDDGSIIIRAENTLFKVYKGTLMQQSELFHDLLTLPQPVDAETIDGCPVVWLEGMSAQEVRLFLVCLHNTAEYHRKMEDFEEIASLLQICHKYLATNLEERIVSHLSPMFPSTLEQFDFSEREDRKRTAPFDYTSPTCNVRIANAARKVGALHLLPAALYRLCRCTPDLLLYSTLSPDNLCAVMVGRSQLSAFARATTFKHLFDSGDGARLRGGESCCCAERLALITRYCQADGWLDPLLFVNFGMGRAACTHCTALLLEQNIEGRPRAWNALPGFFALPEAIWSSAANDRSVELHGAQAGAMLRAARLRAQQTRRRWLFGVAFVGGMLWYYDYLPTRIWRWAAPPPPPPSRWAVLTTLFSRR